MHGTGIYRSTDHGASWTRIDDLGKSGMRNAQTISIATHPQHMLFVSTRHGAYRSMDGGTTWHKTQGSPGNATCSPPGLHAPVRQRPDRPVFSSDGGDMWTRAAGAFGTLPILALADTEAGGRTILYAATTGGARRGHRRCQSASGGSHRDAHPGDGRHLSLRPPADARR